MKLSAVEPRIGGTFVPSEIFHYRSVSTILKSFYLVTKCLF